MGVHRRQRLSLLPTCLLTAVILVAGCGEELNLGPQAKLRIVGIEGLERINPGNTATLKAIVEYSSDEKFLSYKWTASTGQISGQGKSAVYIAPQNPGTDAVTLTVTDGILTEKKTLAIVVSSAGTRELLIGKNIHWPAAMENDLLKFKVKIGQIFSPKIKLRYDVQKDKDKFNAFLSVEINNKIVLANEGVGDDLPGGRSTGEIEVSESIRTPGIYNISFYLKPGNRAKDGWILNSAKLTEVEGTSDIQ